MRKAVLAMSDKRKKIIIVKLHPGQKAIVICKHKKHRRPR